MYVCVRLLQLRMGATEVVAKVADSRLLTQVITIAFQGISKGYCNLGLLIILSAERRITRMGFAMLMFMA